VYIDRIDFIELPISTDHLLSGRASLGIYDRDHSMHTYRSSSVSPGPFTRCKYDVCGPRATWIVWSGVSQYDYVPFRCWIHYNLYRRRGRAVASLLVSLIADCFPRPDKFTHLTPTDRYKASCARTG